MASAQYIRSPTGGVPVNPRTWGDRLLRRRHQRVRLEPAVQSRVLPNGQINGELYTARATRGNVKAQVIHSGTTKHPRGSTYLLHPFTNGGVAGQMPMRMYQPRLRMVGDGPSPSTLATARPIEPLEAV